MVNNGDVQIEKPSDNVSPVRLVFSHWARSTLSGAAQNGHQSRAVTVADFYHRGGNGPTTAGGAVL